MSGSIPRFWLASLLLGAGWSEAASAQALPGVSTRIALQESRLSPEVADLTRIGDLLVLPGERIVVLQPVDQAIRIYSASWRAISVGRKGEGPGEFTNMGIAGQMADSFWVSDITGRKLTLFSPEGALLRTLPFPVTLQPAQGPARPDLRYEMIIPQAIYPGGAMLVAPILAGSEQNPFWNQPAHRGETPVLRIDRNGKVLGGIGWMLGSTACTKVISLPGNERRVMLSTPFCINPMAAISKDGSSRVVLTLPGKEPAYSLVLTRADGSQVFSRTQPYTPIRIPKAAADSARQAKMKAAEKQPAQAAAYREMRFPETYPPVRRVLMGRDGTIWIEEYTLAPAHTWLVLTSSGIPVFRVTLPANIRIAAAETGRIWGVESDADGLEGLVIYRVK